LIDSATGAHLWADRFDGGLDDIFYLQDQITESVVGELAFRNHFARNRSIHIAFGELRRLFRPVFSCLGSFLAFRLATFRGDLPRGASWPRRTRELAQ